MAKRKTLFPKVSLQYEKIPYPLLPSASRQISVRPFFIIIINEVLCFFYCNVSLNILNGGINQIFRWFESVYGLKPDCRTPRVTFTGFVRLRFSQIFLKRVFLHIAASLHGFPGGYAVCLLLCAKAGFPSVYSDR